jgi:3'-phosphoadenosine 5'-phosphosulfate sulfotransferase (PAPS reductase)/FAD synthetase
VGKLTKQNVSDMRKLPLREKILLSLEYLKEFNDYFEGQVYVAYSGGKDSTVLLHLARQVNSDIQAVFSNTSLEFPEIREFVAQTDNVISVKPKVSFKSVIEDRGYPLPNKDVAQQLEILERSDENNKTYQIALGNVPGRRGIPVKWKFLQDAPFKCSAHCCNTLKKYPSKIFERKSGKHPITGLTAAESSMRQVSFVKYGCNIMEGKRPISRPLMFWNEEDIYNYVDMFKLPLSEIYSKGYDRTGCMLCMFGYFDEPPFNNRFTRLKRTHPRIWEWGLETLGYKEVIEYVGAKLRRRFRL